MDNHPAEGLQLRDTLLPQDHQDLLVERTGEAVVLPAEETDLEETGHTVTQDMIQTKEGLCLQREEEDHLVDTVGTKEDHLVDTVGTEEDHLVDMTGTKGVEEMTEEEDSSLQEKGKWKILVEEIIVVLALIKGIAPNVSTQLVHTTL